MTSRSQVVTKNQELIYLLTIERFNNQQQLKVSIFLVYPLKEGGYGSTKKFSQKTISHLSYLYEEDKIILHHLQELKKNVSYHWLMEHSFILEGPTSEEIINLLLKTNRCHWQNKDSEALVLGEPDEGSLYWELASNGIQHLKCKLHHQNAQILPTDPLWYLDHQQAKMGRIMLPVEDSVAAKLINTPPLLPIESKKVRRTIQSATVKIPLPRAFTQTVKKCTLTPKLSLLRETITIREPTWASTVAKKIDIPVARLVFEYDNKTVAANEKGESIDYIEKGKLICIKRDLKKEHSFILKLTQMGFKPLTHISNNHAGIENTYCIGHPTDTKIQLDFMFEHLPQLQKDNWKIEIAKNFPLQCIQEENWYTEVEDKNYDWFGFTLGIFSNGEKINILPLLVDVIKKHPRALDQKFLETLPDNHPFYLRLPDERFISVPAKRVKDILSVLIELYDTDIYQEIKIPRYRAGQLFALQQALNARWLGEEKIRTLAEKLVNFKKIQPISIPKDFNGTLRHYQKQGFYWLNFLQEIGMGGILADDMGLGKTVQILTLLLAQKSKKQNATHLIIAPTSLMDNWRRECQRFTPTLDILILQGDNRYSTLNQIKKVDIVVSTYPLLVRDKKLLLEHSFDYLILDEAQFVKNAKTKAYETLTQIKCQRTICVTGTPIENHLGELWALFNLSVPGLLGNEQKFKKTFRTPIEKENNFQRQKSLNERVSPFMLRRKKEDVIKELPPKTEIIHRIEIHGPQRDLYEGIRLAMEDKVRKAITNNGFSRSHIVILDALLKLRQTCNDPRLLPLKMKNKITQSAKLEFLVEMVSTLVEENKRILLFSSFASMLSLIGQAFSEKNLSWVKLTGATKDRVTPINAFQNKEVPIMLISLKAGGTGLNLTAADTVIHYDPWWNPAAENQATDRAHRIGQDKAVFVYKLVCQGTVEEKILEMQQNKKRLVDNLFGTQKKPSSQLTKEDLDFLFQPLE